MPYHAQGGQRRCTTKDCGNGWLMPESADRFSRHDGRLRRAAAWLGAAGIYGAAQGLSAWATQRAQGRGPGLNTSNSSVRPPRRLARCSRSCGQR
jgi:hypothetical protein